MDIATFKPKNIVRVKNGKVVEVSDQFLCNGSDIGSTCVTRDGDTFTYDSFDPEHGGVPKRSGTIEVALGTMHPTIAEKYHKAFALEHPTVEALHQFFPQYEVIFE
ncbi:MAG: hypothetical protein WCV85_06070 [Patescibacteria group bacterium]